MAIQNFAGSWIAKRAHKTQWNTLANGDTGLPQTGARLSDKTVQVFGTFGAGGSIKIEGSNDGGTTWVTLRDPGGAALTFTSADMKHILEVPERIRPNVTAGDGTTALTCIIVENTTAGM